jgi:homoserine dehydrogenase
VSQLLKIGIAGLGSVGIATISCLQRQQEMLTARAGKRLELVAVSARDRERARGVDLSAYRWYDDPVALAQAEDLDVIIELIGGAEGKARATVTAALQRGTAVVTANKALLASHGLALAALTEQRQTPLLFEAAVAAGVPVIKTLREALTASRILSLRGIINGTCNDILSRMAVADCDFSAALHAAQAAGFAEADATQDIDGHDAAQKLSLLAMIAFGRKIDPAQIDRHGIRNLSRHDVIQAKRDGKIIRLVAAAQLKSDGVPQLRVAPEWLLPQDPLAQLQGPMNGLVIETELAGSLTLSGLGAGGDATATAVIADLVDLARNRHNLPFGMPVANLH